MSDTQDPAGSLLSLPPPQLGADRLLALLQAHWGLGGRLTPLTSERDLNHRLETDAGLYVVKLANPAEPSEMTDFQTAALLHVASVDPSLPTPRIVPARDGRHILSLPEGALRVLTWCEGTPVAHLPRGKGLAGATGAALARLTAALAGFSHPAADHVLLWDIRQFQRLEPLFPALPADLRPQADAFLTRFTTQIAPALATLPRQVLHADFNPHNLVADTARPDHLTGILDFGDMVLTHRVCDLATACSYLVDPDAPLSLLRPMLAAYHARQPLTGAEIALMPDLIAARMLTTLTISAWRAARYPDNAAYILRNAPSARVGLAVARALTPDQILAACESELP